MVEYLVWDQGVAGSNPVFPKFGFTSTFSFVFPSMGQQTLIIAGKLGPEPEILANMYKLLIEENTKLKVEVKPNFGKTTFLYEALKSGDIDIYPEFTGTVTESLLKPAPRISHDPQEVFEAARDGILKQDGLAFLKPMAYQNTYAVAVPRTIAEKYGLKTISDLKKVEGQLKAPARIAAGTAVFDVLSGGVVKYRKYQRCSHPGKSVL